MSALLTQGKRADQDSPSRTWSSEPAMGDQVTDARVCGQQTPAFVPVSRNKDKGENNDDEEFNDE